MPIAVLSTVDQQMFFIELLVQVVEGNQASFPQVAGCVVRTALQYNGPGANSLVGKWALKGKKVGLLSRAVRGRSWRRRKRVLRAFPQSFASSGEDGTDAVNRD